MAQEIGLIDTAHGGVTTAVGPAGREEGEFPAFGLEAQDFWTHIALVLGALVVVVLPRLSGHATNVTIYLVGGTASICIALAAFLYAKARGRTDHHAPEVTEDGSLAEHVWSSLWDWAMQRGVLAGLMLAPLVALLLGLLSLVEARLAYAYVLLAFALLPVWISWRSRHSTDDSEPIRRLHLYAIWAIFPLIVFTLVRIPAFYLLGFVYWGPWYLFGGAAIGAHDTELTSLASGAVLYTMQGYSLSMGYYLFFRRHSFLNMMLYFVVFIPSLYSFVFPVLLMVGMNPHLPFHAINYWAHFWMGLAAWGIPIIWSRPQFQLNRTLRFAAVGALIPVLLIPYAFAFGHATTWQVDRQERREQAAFEAGTLSLDSGPTADGKGTYLVTLRYGPRKYTNFYKAQRLVDVEVLDVDARLLRSGTPVAWCRPVTHALASIATERNPGRYVDALASDNYGRIEMRCAADPALDSQGPLEVQWSAVLELSGERETRTTTLVGRK